MPAHKRLVDDHHVRHARAVSLVEITPGANRNAQRLKISRRDEMTVGDRPLAHRRQRLAHDRDGRRCVAAGQRHAIRQCRRCHARHGRQPLIELLVKGDQLLPFVALRGQHQLRGENAFRLEPRLDALEPRETGQQQPGANQQHQRQRHFRNQQPGAQPLSRGRGTSAGFFERLHDVDARGLQRRQQPDRESGEERHHEREGQVPQDRDRCPARAESSCRQRRRWH